MKETAWWSVYEIGQRLTDKFDDVPEADVATRLPHVFMMAAEMKLAGGREFGDELRVEEFIRQAEQYETGGGAWDTILKILNTVMRTHPMHTVRAAELLRWQRAGGYEKILAGDYVRRGPNEGEQPLSEDFVDAAGYYGQKTRETVTQFKDGLKSAKDAVTSAWRNR